MVLLVFFLFRVVFLKMKTSSSFSHFLGCFLGNYLVPPLPNIYLSYCVLVWSHQFLWSVGSFCEFLFCQQRFNPWISTWRNPYELRSCILTYEDERCRWEWWNNHPSDLREHKLYRLYLISWNRWLNRGFHFMDTKPMQCLWQRIEFHPPKLAKWCQKKNTPPKNKDNKNDFGSTKIPCYFVVSTNFQNMVHFPKK